MSRVSPVIRAAVLGLCLTGMHPSRAELLGLSVPPIRRPAATDVPNALPDAEATLARAWDAYEATCGAVTTAFHHALATQFDRACQAQDSQSLALAEYWKALITRVEAGRCIALRTEAPEHAEDFIKEVRATHAGFANAEHALRSAYAEAVQAYKEARNVVRARELANEMKDLIDSCRLPGGGIHRVLCGRWDNDANPKEYVRVFSGANHLAEYARHNMQEPHSRGDWQIVFVPPAGNHDPHTFFSRNRDRLPPRAQADLIATLDNGWFAKIALIDADRMLFEPVQPEGRALLCNGDYFQVILTRVETSEND